MLSLCSRSLMASTRLRWQYRVKQLLTDPKLAQSNSKVDLVDPLMPQPPRWPFFLASLIDYVHLHTQPLSTSTTQTRKAVHPPTLSHTPMFPNDSDQARVEATEWLVLRLERVQLFQVCQSPAKATRHSRVHEERAQVLTAC